MMNSDQFDVFFHNSHYFRLSEDENGYFHAVLPTPLYFEPNQFAVALTDFSYDTRKLIHLPYGEFKVFYKDPKRNHRVILRNARFQSVTELRALLRRESEVEFESLEDGVLQIVLPDGAVKVEFYDENLIRMLGFRDSTLRNSDVAKLPPNIYANVDQLYVTCDFCDVRIVNALFLPVLRQLSVDYKVKRAPVTERFDVLSFVDVVVSELHSAKISIVNQFGEYVNFAPGANFSCSLRFKSVL